jgi:hypothetical protein
MQVEFHNIASVESISRAMKTVGGTPGYQPVERMRSVMTRMLDKDLRVFSSEPNVWYADPSMR